MLVWLGKLALGAVLCLAWFQVALWIGWWIAPDTGLGLLLWLAAPFPVMLLVGLWMGRKQWLARVRRGRLRRREFED